MAEKRSTPVVDARDLLKYYGKQQAVTGLSFEVKVGQCFGLLGPNGAGKSTVMRMLYGLSPLSGGDLFIMGLDAKTSMREIKKVIGIVPQEDGLDPDFSVRDNLRLYSSYLNLKRKPAEKKIEELLRMVQLLDWADAPVTEMSGGMKRRLVIARALLNEPRILFLDEPTTGLDPQARLWVWEFLAELKRGGVSLLLTTHYMEEAEQLCDELVIMDHGKVVARGVPRELITKYVGQEVIDLAVAPESQAYYARRLSENYEYQLLSRRMRVYLKEADSSAEILKLVESDHVMIRRASLDDVFLRLTGHPLSISSPAEEIR